MKELIQIRKKETIKEVEELSELFGLKGTFGEEVRTIEVCILLAKNYIKSLQQSIPEENEDKLTIIFTTIERVRKSHRIASLDKNPRV